MEITSWTPFSTKNRYVLLLFQGDMLLISLGMKVIRQKRKRTSLESADQYMLIDISDTNVTIKKKLREAESFYKLMECTTADFLRGSTITEHDNLIISPEISQLYFKIQSVIKHCTPKSQALFNQRLMEYTDALAQGENLAKLQRSIIPLFKFCLRESIDIICQKYAFSGN